ncbi:microtubule-associated serine/threonine-protein kinase 3-like [Dermacentor albipictus]|uniref:microtubule-associated serine/threonine-protein kinase 3-like n=1 Tax=Dermacentor albipictus TaxID=60249 RepID=UPI0038FC5D76
MVAVALPPPTAAMEEKKRTAAKVVTTLFPRIPKVTTVLLDFFIRRESKVELAREPLSHFCQEEVVLAAQDMVEKLNRQVITFQDIRDTAENLIGLHNLTYKKAQYIAKELGDNIRKLIVIVGELATSLEKVSDVPPTDWMDIGDTIVAKTEKVNPAEIAPFWTFIPKMKDFLSIKLLGAGGFGAVYKAAYKPTSLVCTIKLVACDRFQRHKQACIDKVVASVVRCPFLVKYYACYCTRDAYVTVMEYICGADLMRVVDKAVYLPTEECRIVMAQLILALEHMHLRGLLHRDIKVSNMLIIPGGRVKVIDFDTNKVCIGHFSKRVCRGYFSKTAFEFHDGESAGTVPYMAPEILKRRPYGRACDWWSAGATMYKMMTGRVPFRGETKGELMDKITNQPLRWPKVEEHPHSATPEAKDMVFKMLKKNPVERLGSTTYAEIKEHPFFAGFNWKRLSSAKDICNIPAIGDCMTRKKGDGKPERLTVSATSNTRKRKLLKVEDMVDVEAQTQRPLYTFSSPSFKKMINFAKKQAGPVQLKESFFNTSGGESDELDYKKASDVDVRAGISAYSGTGASADKSITAKERMDVILFRTKSLGKYWSFGVNIVDVDGENNRRFIMVEKVKSGSPAEASHVLEGDVIVAVNGQDIGELPIAEVRRRMHDGGDQLVVTVLSSSAFRLLESRRDWAHILRAAGQDTLQLRAIKTACGGSGNYGFKTVEAQAWNEQRKALVHCHVIQKATEVQVTTPNKRLYPGDVLLMVDGVPVDTMDQRGVRAALAKGADELSITVAPMSPLRLRRPSYTRLHETVMSDANVPEPSAKANIEAAPQK